MSAGTPKGSPKSKKEDPPAAQVQEAESNSSKGAKGRGKRRQRQQIEVMSVVDDSEKLSAEKQEFFKSNKCNYFIGLRLPESIRQVMFESLYYMVDFRRFERRRLHLSDPEKFHTTLVNLAVPRASVDKAIETFEKCDVSALNKCDVNIGQFGSFPGPHVYARMAEKGSAGNIPKAIKSIEKAFEAAEIHTRVSTERKYKGHNSEYIHCTLVKPTRLGGKKRGDRGLSEAKAVQHVLSENYADAYDWSVNGEKAGALADVDVPADAAKMHHVVSLDLCTMSEDGEDGYYKVIASKKVNVGFQMGDMKYFQKFVKDVEVETGKRVKTGEALKEAEAEKAKKRELAREERKKREAEEGGAPNKRKGSKGKGKGKGRRGKGKGKGSEKKEGEDGTKKEGGEKKEGGGKRRSRGKGKGKSDKTESGDKKETGEKKEKGEKREKGSGKRTTASDNEGGEQKKPSGRGKGSKGKGKSGGGKKKEETA